MANNEKTAGIKPKRNFIHKKGRFKKSLLLDVPPEVRNRIYKEVAHYPKRITIRKGKLVSHDLARTCKLVRSEFKPVFFAARGILNPDTVSLEIDDFNFENAMRTICRCVSEAPRSININISVYNALPFNESNELVPDLPLLSGPCKTLLAWVKACSNLKTETEGLKTAYEVTFLGKDCFRRYWSDNACMSRDQTVANVASLCRFLGSNVTARGEVRKVMKAIQKGRHIED